MSDFFRDLGRKAGRTLRQGNWILQSFTGTDGDAIAAEHALGRDLAVEIERDAARLDDPDRQDWIARVGAELVPRVKEKRRRFAFAILEGEQANAFALPGGFIYVERPLMELCGWNAHEVAFVLAHEMAHVVKGHTLERYVGSRCLERLAGAAPIGGVAGMLVKQVGLSFLTSAYSREQEMDADHLGLRLSVASGFEAEAGPRLLGRLQEATGGDVSHPLLAYFASHPPLLHRIATLRRLGAS